MKVTVAVRMGLAIAAFLTAGALGAQAPGGGPGFGDHRPPMERALGPRGEHGRWWNDAGAAERCADEFRSANEFDDGAGRRYGSAASAGHDAEDGSREAGGAAD